MKTNRSSSVMTNPAMARPRGRRRRPTQEKIRAKSQQTKMLNPGIQHTSRKIARTNPATPAPLPDEGCCRG